MRGGTAPSNVACCPWPSRLPLTNAAFITGTGQPRPTLSAAEAAFEPSSAWATTTVAIATDLRPTTLLPHGDHDLARGMPLDQVPHRRADFGQRIAPVDRGHDLAGGQQLAQRLQILAIHVGHE